MKVLAIGLGATLCLDLWNLMLKRMFGISSLNYCLLGRWISHLPKGTFRHASIAAASPMRHECRIGWTGHYLIGMSLASAFLFLNGAWLAHPTLLPALMYGIATVVFPYFVMQPALGLGVASARAANPAAARLKSLATHAIFGVDIYACALVWEAIK